MTKQDLRYFSIPVFYQAPIPVVFFSPGARSRNNILELSSNSLKNFSNAIHVKFFLLTTRQTQEDYDKFKHPPRGDSPE